MISFLPIHASESSVPANLFYHSLYLSECHIFKIIYNMKYFRIISLFRNVHLNYVKCPWFTSYFNMFINILYSDTLDCIHYYLKN